jgi:GTP-binding protein
MTLPVVAIVGRPNVGKSRLFNRLAGERKAVVDDQSGVTRDRLYHEATLIDRRVVLVDTGGIETDDDSDLLVAMRHQSMVAVEEAEVIVFVVDGLRGLLPADTEVAAILRRSSKPVLLVVNKIDGPKHDDNTAEFWQLGMEPLLPVSAAHGRGIFELMDAIVAALPAGPTVTPTYDDDPRGEDDEDAPLEQGDDGEIDGDALVHEPAGPIRIAVIGRPNIGKSTMVNRLLGEERHVVHDAPGTTMDPVDSALVVGDRTYILVDTAGVRRPSKIDTQLERFVSLRSIRMIERCHVCVLVVDAIEGITDQDAKLAELVIDRGRALILLFNKWDLVKGHEDISSQTVEEDIGRKLPHATFAPFLFVSAKTGKGTHRILPMIDQVFAGFERRIPTSQLNAFIERTVAAHHPPQSGNHPVRIYYGTQVRVRPPTFSLWSNAPEAIGPAYVRYLQNRMRQEWDFQGSPVRIQLKRRRKLGE